jgi:hypothetical protein
MTKQSLRDNGLLVNSLVPMATLYMCSRAPTTSHRHRLMRRHKPPTVDGNFINATLHFIVVNYVRRKFILNGVLYLYGRKQ